MEIKVFQDCITVLKLTYTSETCTWNEIQRSSIQEVEMSFLRAVWCEKHG